MNKLACLALKGGHMHSKFFDVFLLIQASKASICFGVVSGWLAAKLMFSFGPLKTKDPNQTL